MHLIEGWKNAWKLTSIQATALLALFSVLQAEVLPLIQFAIPERYFPWVTAAFGVSIVLLRIIAQPSVLAGAAPDEAPAPPTSRQAGFITDTFMLLAAVALGALLIGFLTGVTHANQNCTKTTVKAETKAATAAASATVATAVVAASAADKQVEIKTVFKDRIVKQYVEVPREVVRKEDAGCVIPRRFVGLWNTANRAELPTFAGQLDASPSGIALSAVAAEHDREAELCTANTEQLKALQSAERARQKSLEAAQ